MDKSTLSGILAFFAAFTIAIVSCTDRAKPAKDPTDGQITKIVNNISADSIEHNIRTLVHFKTRHTASDTTSDSTGIGAARRWIYHTMQRYSRQTGGRLKVRYAGYTQPPMERLDNPTRVVDVVAVLPGTQPKSKDRMYVVSGHYDSRVTDVMNDTSYAPGADDDASGTAAVMEIARVMSQYKFDATLVFMTVAGEEQGLLGSTYYAKQAKKQHKNIAGMLNNDIIGTGKGPDSLDDSDVVRVFAQGIPPSDTLSRHNKLLLYTGGENDTRARELGRFVHRLAEHHVRNLRVNLIYRTDRYLRGGDHLPFLQAGYPAVRFTEPHESYHHQHANVRTEDGSQYGDLPKFVDFDYVRKVAALNAATLTELANAPARPQKVRLLVTELTNNTTLKWQANSEPDMKGYEIVWRKTHAPYWQHSKMISDTATQYTVKNRTKDNWLFGVRSVDTAGYKSPAVYPLPGR